MSRPVHHISEFDYTLPEEKIAFYPLDARHDSKLLCYREGEILDGTFSNLHNRLPSGAHLVLNETKVLPVRLFFRKETGGLLQVFLLEPVDEGSMEQALERKDGCHWNCLVGGLKKWKQGRIEMEVPLEDGDIKVYASQEKRNDDSVQLSFEWEGSLTWSEVLDAAGRMPLPPYIHRESESLDLDRYQSVFSRIRGSVAAPTASLHFDDEVFDGLNQAGIEQTKVCLHVGAGTFKPVSTDQITDHGMHQEYFQVDRDAIASLASTMGPIIPVGTTALRTVESLYWLGLMIYHGASLDDSDRLSQWHVYDQKQDLISRREVFSHMCHVMDKARRTSFEGFTSLMIAPGYNFQVAEGLITNFHQPKSTLLLLVAAMIGQDWKRVYQHALNTGYRFLSYGDGSLLLPKA